MSKLKNIIVIIIIILVLFAVILLFPKILDKGYSENIVIKYFKDSYSDQEQIVVKGETKKNSDIILFFSELPQVSNIGKIYLLKSDENGKWQTNLGKLPKGKYSLQFLAKVSSDKDSFTARQIVVTDEVKNLIFDELKAHITSFFK